MEDSSGSYTAVETDDKPKQHVFIVAKRPRVYSEPDLDILEGGGATYAEVDYSKSSRVVKKFRKDYANWRKGKAKGAKGQIRQVTSAAATTVDAEASQVGTPLSSVEVSHNPNSMGFTNALLNSINYNLGLSVLSVPYCFSRLGWITVPILFVASAMSLTTAHMIGNLLASGATSFADISNAVVPRKYRSFCSSVIRAVQVLELFSYLGYGNVALYNLSSSVFSIPAVDKLFVYAVLFVLSVPAAVIRSLDVLALASKVGVFSYVVCVICILQDCVHGEHNVFNPKETVFVNGSLFDFLEVIGIILLLFAGHAAYPAIYFSLERKEDFGRVVNATFAIIFAAMLILGCVCYLKYGTSVDPIVATNVLDPVLGKVAVGLLLIKLYSSNFLMVFPLVREVEHILADRLIYHTTREDKIRAISLDLDNDLEEHLLPRLDSVLPEDLETVHKLPLFHTFLFAKEDERGPRGIFTDPISRRNHHRRNRGQSNDSDQMQPFQDSPVLIALAARNRCQTLEDVTTTTQVIAHSLEVIIRSTLILLGFAFAVAIPSIEFVMAMIGSLFAVNISITFPAGLSYMASRKADPQWLYIILIIVGLSVMVSSTYAGIVSEVNK